MTAWVFVYGTLKQGFENHHLVAPFVREVRAGTIPGVLLDLGGYPGWLPPDDCAEGGEARVSGEAFRLSPLAPALEILDTLEDYQGPGDPANLYERVRVTVSTSTGDLTSWAYRYTGPARGEHVVRGGRWAGVRGGM